MSTAWRSLREASCCAPLRARRYPARTLLPSTQHLQTLHRILQARATVQPPRGPHSSRARPAVRPLAARHASPRRARASRQARAKAPKAASPGKLRERPRRHGKERRPSDGGMVARQPFVSGGPRMGSVEKWVSLAGCNDDFSR
jgi:hypothetical protein